MIVGLVVDVALVLAITGVVVWRLGVYREVHRADTPEERDAAEWWAYVSRNSVLTDSPERVGPRAVALPRLRRPR